MRGKNTSNGAICYSCRELAWSPNVFDSLLAGRHRNAEGIIFYRCDFFFFLSFFFFRRLISEVTERISTKLGHIFTYDCYLKNLVRTPMGIYPPTGWGQKRFLEPILNIDRNG